MAAIVTLIWMPLKYVFVSILLIFYAVAASQEAMRESELKLRFNKNKIHLNSIPFDKVQVLDNRFDKSSIFIDQIGEYPITKLSMANTAKTIEGYFDEVVNQFSNGKDTLVISVEEFRVPNRRVLIEREGKNNNLKSYSRHHIQLSAICYRKNRNNLYSKVVTINKKYDIYYPPVPIQTVIEEILNDIIQSASIGSQVDGNPLETRKRVRHLVNDSTAFRYESDRTFRTLEEINVPVETKWKHFPIFNHNDIREGNYRTFEDLKKDSLSKNSFCIQQL